MCLARCTESQQNVLSPRCWPSLACNPCSLFQNAWQALTHRCMSQAHPYLVCTKPAYLQLQDAVAPPLSEDFLARMVWEECSLVEGCALLYRRLSSQACLISSRDILRRPCKLCKQEPCRCDISEVLCWQHGNSSAACVPAAANICATSELGQVEIARAF